ncbi:hypothetical protein L9F63_016816, partial [Diploptera punctata]
ARYAGIVLPLSQPLYLGAHKPNNLLFSRFSRELREVLLAELSYDTNVDSSNIYFRYTQRHGGLSRNVIEAEFFAANLDLYLARMKEIILPSDDITIYRPAIPNLPRSTRSIKEALNIAQRIMPKFEGDVHIVLDKLYERMFPLGKQFFVDIARAGRKLIDDMKKGHVLNYQKASLKSALIYVITELGFPVNFNIQVPSLIRVNTNTKINSEEMELILEMNGLYTSQLMSDISFYTAIDKTVHMAASHGITLINVPPVRVVANLRSEQKAVDLHLEALDPKNNNAILHHSTKPFTSQHEVFSSYNNMKTNMRIVRNEKSTQKSLTILPNINLKYTTEWSNDNPYAWLKNGISVQGFCMISPHLEANTVEIEIDTINAMDVQLSIGRGIVEENNIIISNTTKKRHDSTNDVGLRSTYPLPMKANLHVSPTRSSLETTTILSEPAPIEETTESLYGFGYNLADIPKLQVRLNSMNNIANFTNITSTTHKPSMARKTTSREEKTDDDDLITNGIFNATNVNPFIQKLRGKESDYILGEMLNGIRNGRALILNIRATRYGEDVRSYDLHISHATSMSEKVRRISVFYQSVQPQSKITQ